MASAGENHEPVDDHQTARILHPPEFGGSGPEPGSGCDPERLEMNNPLYLLFVCARFALWLWARFLDLARIAGRRWEERRPTVTPGSEL